MKDVKDLENVEKHTPLSMPPLTPVADAMPAGQARQTMHSAKSTVDRVCDEAEAIVVEDTDEDNYGANEGGVQNDEGETTDKDDNSELGTCFITSIYIHRLIGQLVRLQKDWDAPVYIFFKPFPTIQYVTILGSIFHFLPFLPTCFALSVTCSPLIPSHAAQTDTQSPDKSPDESLDHSAVNYHMLLLCSP